MKHFNYVVLFISVFCFSSSHHHEVHESIVQDEPDSTTNVFTPIKVSLYYEALCPDSVNFIENELFPTWLGLSQYINIDWLPYGKAQHRNTSDGSYTFQCQHGPLECRGNMIQACALSFLNAEQSTRWIKCVMASAQPYNAGSRCSNTLHVDYEPIKDCSNSKRGKQLLAEYGDRTHALRPRLTFVPTVTFDGIYSAEKQRRSMQDFRGVICDIVKDRIPSADCE